MWHKRLQQHWNRTKSFIHQGYRTLGKWAGEMDKGVSIGRKAFSAIAPILDELGASQYVDQGMKAIKGYDALRGQVSEIDDNVRRHASRIGQADLFS